MKIADIEIALTRETRGDKAVWAGFILYKDKPVEQVIGWEFPKDGSRNIHAGAALNEEGSKKEKGEGPDHGWIDIGILPAKGHKFVKLYKFTAFGLEAPMQGWIFDKEGTPCVKLRLDQGTLDYYSKPETAEKLAERGKELPIFRLEVPGTFDLETLEEYQRGLGDDYQRWYDKHFKKTADGSIKASAAKPRFLST